MSKEYPVKGTQQLDAFLSVFPKNMQNSAYRVGLTAAAAVVRDEARLKVNSKTGKLARSISSGSPRRMPDGTFMITVGPRDKEHSFLGLFHEFGVRPHYLVSGTSSLKPRKLTEAARNSGQTDVATRALKINGEYVTGQILHPGYAPKPFLRPALDAKAQEALDAFADRIRSFIEGKTGLALTEEAA